MKYNAIIAVAAILLTSVNAHAATVSLKGTVAQVHDGDTFKLASGQSVRIAGIDAPELGQPYGTQARDILHNLVIDKEVTCRVTRRSWGRVVARCKVADVDIGAAMVIGGWAWNAPEFGDRYRPQQLQAACGRTGLWAEIGPVVPRDWRRCR